MSTERYISPKRAMISYKTDSEIAVMRSGGKILSQALSLMFENLALGMSTREIDSLGKEYILSQGATPSFTKVAGYSDSTCICVNDQVVHTPPSDRIIKEGDMVTIDCGVYYRGFHTDKAETVVVGKSSKEKNHFLQIGKDTLRLALGQVRVGSRIGHISRVIEREISKAGYKVIYELTGHGVGRELHEEPMIPGFLQGNVSSTPIIKPGMTLAVEVIYAMATHKVKLESGSKWSLVTVDSSLSACFESTVAVFKNKAEILA